MSCRDPRFVRGAALDNHLGLSTKRLKILDSPPHRLDLCGREDDEVAGLGHPEARLRRFVLVEHAMDPLGRKTGVQRARSQQLHDLSRPASSPRWILPEYDLVEIAGRKFTHGLDVTVPSVARDVHHADRT